MQMHLGQLKLLHFKNHHERVMEFSPGFNCITGQNGMGKTNVLDAIHYLAMCKSYFSGLDRQNIEFGQDFFTIRGEVVTETVTHVISCHVPQQSKKVFKVDGVEPERFADHIGWMPVAVVSPYDTDLIDSGSEVRRKFMDGLIAQTDKSYLNNLIKYSRLLAQRNALLKKLKEGQGALSALDIYDEQMVELGEDIFKAREKFVEEMTPQLETMLEKISGSRDSSGIQYKSHHHQGHVKEQVDRAKSRDLALGHSSVGVHRDDLVFTLQDLPLKKIGSQGQRKTYLIALKLAQFTLIMNRTGRRPLLLLDDVFDKLDDQRVHNLLELPEQLGLGQVFITDTSRKRLEGLLGSDDTNYIELP